MKEGGEFVTNSEKESEKGNEKASEEVTLVTYSKMKGKVVRRSLYFSL